MSFVERMLNFFGRVIEFVVDFTLPVVKIIKKAYQVFKLVLTLV